MQKLFQDLWITIFGSQKPDSSPAYIMTSQTATSTTIKQNQDKPVRMDDLLRALGADL